MLSMLRVRASWVACEAIYGGAFKVPAPLPFVILSKVLCLTTLVAKLFCLFTVVCSCKNRKKKKKKNMSFDELRTLTENLGDPVLEETPAPIEERQELDARLESLATGLEEVRGQQRELLTAVTALARHVVCSHSECTHTSVEPTGSVLSASPAMPSVRPTNVPVNTISCVPAPAVSPGFRVVSVAGLPGPPSGCAPSAPFSFQLSPKEALASLLPFGGNSEKSALVLDNDSFIEFQEWFSASLWKLSAAGVPAEAHAALLAQKLTGPLQKLFIREQDIAPVNIAALSANDLRSRLSGFYQDATVRFSDAVLTMHFRKEHLAQDIAKFRTYALHSHFVSTLDGNEWIYSQLRRKMHGAWPQCLMLAATEFQLTLNPSLPFNAYVDQALKIAARLQSQLGVKSSSDSKPADTKQQKNQPLQATGKKRSAGPTLAKGPAKAQKSAPPPLSETEERALLKRFNRCFKCAWRLEQGQAHTCDPKAKAKRVEAIRRDEEAGPSREAAA
jgi:hypothetical protein